MAITKQRNSNSAIVRLAMSCLAGFVMLILLPALLAVTSVSAPLLTSAHQNQPASPAVIERVQHVKSAD